MQASGDAGTIDGVSGADPAAATGAAAAARVAVLTPRVTKILHRWLPKLYCA